ncbi:MAG: sulfotransferase [Actinobacteria bacterium]|nr:sulfotransferase [Actinomycetota bacterium]
MKELARRLIPFRLRRWVWSVRRSAPRAARPLSVVLPRADPPPRPILVLGCPRSGTSALLDLLLASPGLGGIHNEGHILWDEFHHPRDRGWDSDALGRADVGERERAYIYRAIRIFASGERFTDKTAENVLRIPYLQELFGDATFVFIRRRGADTVNSLMEAWKARPRFVKYRLPEPLQGLGELSGNEWSFSLIPGWRELRDAPLEEVCARQYVASNEAALAGREGVEPERWVEVSYEELFADPVPTAERLFEELGLTFEEAIRAHAADFARNPSSTALTAPRPDKWREQNGAAIERILPLLEPVERRLGY